MSSKYLATIYLQTPKHFTYALVKPVVFVRTSMYMSSLHFCDYSFVRPMHKANTLWKRADSTYTSLYVRHKRRRSYMHEKLPIHMR